MTTVPPAEWSLLKGLTPDQVESTPSLAVARPRTYRRGTTVFHQGNPGDSVHVVTRGHFAFRVPDEGWRIGARCACSGPGETFGRVTIPGRVTPRMGTIVALDAGETYELSREQVKQLRATYPEVANAIIADFEPGTALAEPAPPGGAVQCDADSARPAPAHGAAAPVPRTARTGQWSA